MTSETMAAYRVVIPGVPDPELSPNARVDRRVKARKVKQWRETAGWAAKAAAPERPLAGPLAVTATICWPRGRRRHDADNAVSLCKPLFDGLSGIVWEDDRQIVELSVRQDKLTEAGRDMWPFGCTVVDVERIEQA